MNLETEFSLISEGTQPASRPKRKLAGSRPAPAKAPAAAVARTMQQLIDNLPEQIALLDEQCNILAANRAWTDIVEQYGHLDALPGRNYRDFCAAKAAEGYEPAIEAVAALDDITSGRRSLWQLVYNGGERWGGHDYQICIHWIAVGSQSLISVTRFDLTEILALRRANDRFTRSPIEAGRREPGSDALFEETMCALVGGFSEQVAVVDENWTILAANEAWRAMAEEAGYAELERGRDYRLFLDGFVDKGYASASAVRAGIAAIDAGTSNSFELTYAGDNHWKGRTLHLRINRLQLYGRTLATITREDSTDAAEIRRLREELAASVTRGQAEERQRQIETALQGSGFEMQRKLR